MTDEVRRLRPPRFISSDSIIRPYSFKEAEGHEILRVRRGEYSLYRYSLSTHYTDTHWVLTVQVLTEYSLYRYSLSTHCTGTHWVLTIQILTKYSLCRYSLYWMFAIHTLRTHCTLQVLTEYSLYKYWVVTVQVLTEYSHYRYWVLTVQLLSSHCTDFEFSLYRYSLSTQLHINKARQCCVSLAVAN